MNTTEKELIKALKRAKSIYTIIAILEVLNHVKSYYTAF